MAAALNTSCADAKVPVWNGRLFFGDSDRGGLSRGGVDPDFIPLADKPRFNNMVCMSRPDFESWNSTYIGGCKEWKGRPGSIMVESRVLQQLMIGERQLSDLQPGEYQIVSDE